MAHIIITGRYLDGQRMLKVEPAESHAAAWELAEGMNKTSAGSNHYAWGDELGRRYNITEPVRVCDCEKWDTILAKGRTNA